MAVIEILGTDVIALSAVDDRVARADGESYKTAAGWRSEHERFWREEAFPAWEGEVPVLDDSTAVVVEWFRLQKRLRLLVPRQGSHEGRASASCAGGG